MFGAFRAEKTPGVRASYQSTNDSPGGQSLEKLRLLPEQWLSQVRNHILLFHAKSAARLMGRFIVGEGLFEVIDEVGGVLDSD